MNKIVNVLIVFLLVLQLQVQSASVEMAVPLVEFRGEVNQSTELVDIYTFIEPAVTVQFTDEWLIYSGLVFEPVKDIVSSRILQDHGLFIEELNIEYAKKNWVARLGKFNPGFGEVWDRGPGVWGRKGMPEEYEVAEKIGVGGSYVIASNKSEHEISASFFKADESDLGRKSLFTDRDSNVDAVTQTNGLESYVISLSGQCKKRDLGYYVAYRSLAKGRKTKTDSGMAIGMSYETNAANLTVKPIAEYVSIVNMDGDNPDVEYLTLGTTVELSDWYAAIAHTARNNESNNDYQIQFSVGYTFKNNIKWDVGWRNVSVADEIASFVGTRISLSIQ